MGYDAAIVHREVSRILSKGPARTLDSIAAELRIDRHTIARDLKRVGGITFRQLQARSMLDALARMSIERPLMKKEMADRLGLRSARALRAWMERLAEMRQSGQTCSKVARTAPALRRPLQLGSVARRKRK